MYYIVGKAIPYIRGSFHGNIQKIPLTQEAVKQSIVSQSELKVFLSLEDAKKFAQTLQEDKSNEPTPRARAKIPPIFTVEIDDDAVLKNPITAIINVKNFLSPTEANQRCEIKYYLVERNNISKITRAEFDNPNLPVFEFKSKSIGCCLV